MKCPDGYEVIERKIGGGPESEAARLLIEGRYINASTDRLEQYEPDLSMGLHRKLAGIPMTEKGALAFITSFGGFIDYKQERLDTIFQIANDLKTTIQAIDTDNLEEACEWFNKHVTTRMTAKIYPIEAGKRPLQIVPSPNTLLGYIWLNVASEITGGRSFKKCAYCSEYFSVGKDAKTKRAVFCKTKCRVAWNRAKSR